MNILAFSDTHGLDMCVPGSMFWEGVPEGDVDIVCIAGDIMPLECQSNHAEGAEWLENEFFPQVRKVLDKCGAELCLMTPGNHDFIFETDFMPKFPEYIKVLIDECYEFNKGEETYKVYGTPWCNMTTRYRWAFDTKDEDLLSEKYSNLPEYIDVFITHCPPYGTPASQQIRSWYRDCPGEFVDYGNISLKKVIDEFETAPSVLLCGHIHEQLCDRFQYSSTDIYNVSVKDENYVCYKKPFLIKVQ